MSIQIGTYITDGTCKWIIDDIRDKNTVGQIFFDSILHTGCLRANGATITDVSINYPRLLKYLQDNPSLLAANQTAYNSNVGLFLYDDVQDTLIVPNYIGRVIQGAANVSTIAAGLPNITGFFYIWRWSSGSNIVNGPSGAFYMDNGSNADSIQASGTKQKYQNIYFNASRSSSIYGNSTTVQPPAITQIPQFKY